MILPIYLYGSSVLRQVAKEVDIQNEAGLKEFIEDMNQTMINADGCGIAAPQVGRSLRILIVDGKDLTDKYPELKDFHRVMINPVVLEESSETTQYSEGCLSIPNVDADIVRPRSIKVRYIDENFVEKEEEFDLFAARMVQHELDHLEGKVFTDHASPIRKKMISGKLNGISKGHVRTSYKVRTDKK